MKIEELIKDLDPVTIIEFKNYVVENLGEICKTKNSNSKVISNHRNGETICKNCKVKMNKNGKTKNEVQKYICKHCGYTCSETTNTIVSHSHLPFDVWSKDTRQLLANYRDVPQNMIKAIVDSNETRKGHIANMILSQNPSIVGIYRLTMKKDSDNFRASAIQDIIKNLSQHDIDILIYEPTLTSPSFNGYQVIKDFDEFAERSDIILANRFEKPLTRVRKKVYTRDLYSKD